MRKERGITLVALVITIIVLLILAGVTINLTLGERGIFRTAQKAAQESEIAAYLEKIELARVEVSSKNMGEVTIEDLVAQIYKDKVVPDGSITIVEDYAVMVTEERVYNINNNREIRICTRRKNRSTRRYK